MFHSSWGWHIIFSVVCCIWGPDGHSSTWDLKNLSLSSAHAVESIQASEKLNVETIGHPKMYRNTVEPEAGASKCRTFQVVYSFCEL